MPDECRVIMPTGEQELTAEETEGRGAPGPSPRFSAVSAVSPEGIPFQPQLWLS